MAKDDQKQPEAAEQTAEHVAEQQAEASDAGAEGAPPTEGTAAESLEDTVVRLEAELAQARDAALRAQADAQNVARRAEQDVEKARKYALERFTSELLPVVDNLERALEAASGDEATHKPIAEGVELTLKSFLDAMRKFNIDVVDPEGEPFDPNLHQAMTMVENNDVEPNTVLTVMQRGYTLNGRLVRPAMVVVSKSGG